MDAIFKRISVTYYFRISDSIRVSISVAYSGG